METNWKDGGKSDSDLALTALQSLKHVTCSKPRRLSESEIELLRQSKVEIARQVVELYKLSESEKR